MHAVCTRVYCAYEITYTQTHTYFLPSKSNTQLLIIFAKEHSSIPLELLSQPWLRPSPNIALRNGRLDHQRRDCDSQYAHHHCCCLSEVSAKETEQRYRRQFSGRSPPGVIRIPREGEEEEEDERKVKSR